MKDLTAHFLSLPFFHPLFCLFLITIANVIPYKNFFQAVAYISGLEGFWTMFYSNLLVHALRDATHVTFSALFDHLVLHFFPHKKKKKKRKKYFLARLSPFGKFLCGVVSPLITTFLTVTFIVILTRILVYHFRSNEVFFFFSFLSIL